MSPPMRAAVIGGGPAGLAAACELVRSGVRVDLYEQSGSVGGMARSISLWGQTVDVGPHVLQGGDSTALELWREIAGDVRELPSRRALLRKGRLLEYPPGIIALLHGLSPRELVACSVRLAAARLNGGADAPADAKGWFVARYGDGLYDAVLRPYLEKLWGCGGGEIDASYINSVSAAASQAPSRSGASRLSYPVAGLSSVWERLADRIRGGGEILLDARVTALRMTREILVCQDNGDERPYDAVLSAAPIRALLAMLPPPPAHVTEAVRGLRVRHMVIVHARVQRRPALRHAWVFVADRRLAVGRVSDSGFWQGRGDADEGIVTMEYWCDDADAVWNESEAEVRARAARELHDTGLYPHLRVLDVSVLRLRGVLPVPTVGYGLAVEAVQRHVHSHPGVYTMGRHGSFAFDSTMAAIASGLATARRAIAESRPVSSRATSTPVLAPSPD
jgi:protoporphyrinogen oxidase